MPRARHEFSAILQIAQPVWRYGCVNDDAFEGGLEEENRRLKKMCAKERLKGEIVAEAMLKKGRAVSMPEMALWVVKEKAVRIRLVCQALGISQTCYRYQAKLSSENSEIADWLIRLTANQRNQDFGPCFSVSA